MSVRFDAVVGASAQAPTRNSVKPTDVITPLALGSTLELRLVSDQGNQLGTREPVVYRMG
jgi:hypothetical protein